MFSFECRWISFLKIFLVITVMLIYRHLVIMANSGKLSYIIGLEKCEVYTTKKSQYSFCISFNLSQKRAITSIENSQMTSNFIAWPVFFYALPFLKIWKKWMHPFKSYWPKTTNWQFSQNLSQKRAITPKTFCGLPPYQNWPVFYVAWLFCKV